MDNVGGFMRHCPINEACQFTSPLISVEMFKEQCALQIGQEVLFTLNKSAQTMNAKKEEVVSTDEEEFATLLKTDKQTISELEEVCSIEHLKVQSK